jgi:hypothetical protein
MDKLFLVGILIDEEVEKSLSDLIKKEPSVYITGSETNVFELSSRFRDVTFKFKGFRVLDIDDEEFLDIDLDYYLENDLNICGLELSKEWLSTSRKINAFASENVRALTILPLICNNRLLDVSDSVGLDYTHIIYGIGNDLEMNKLIIKIDPISKKYNISFNEETLGGNLYSVDTGVKLMTYSRREYESLLDDILELFGLSKIDGTRIVNNIAFLTKQSGSFVVPNGVTKIVMTWNAMYKNLNIIVPKTVVDFGVTDYEPNFNNVTFYLHKESDKAFLVKLIKSYFEEDTFDADDFDVLSLKELAELCSNLNLIIDFY